MSYADLKEKLSFYRLIFYVKTLYIFSLALLSLACGTTYGPAAPTPRVVPAPDSDYLTAMCQHLGPKAQGGLGCPEGEPVYDSDVSGPKGVPNTSCVEAYQKMQRNGIFVNPKCLIKVRSCVEIEDARKHKCE